MKAETMQKYQSAIVYLYTISEFKGYITNSEIQEVASLYKISKALASELIGTGYLIRVKRSVYEFVLPLQSIKMSELCKKISDYQSNRMKEWKKTNKKKQLRCNKSLMLFQEAQSTPLRITLTAQQQSECVIALLEDKPYSFNITDKEQIKSILINYINDKIKSK